MELIISGTMVGLSDLNVGASKILSTTTGRWTGTLAESTSDHYRSPCMSRKEVVQKLVRDRVTYIGKAAAIYDDGTVGIDAGERLSNV